MLRDLSDIIWFDNNSFFSLGSSDIVWLNFTWNTCDNNRSSNFSLLIPYIDSLTLLTIRLQNYCVFSNILWNGLMFNADSSSSSQCSLTCMDSFNNSLKSLVGFHCLFDLNTWNYSCWDDRMGDMDGGWDRGYWNDIGLFACFIIESNSLDYCLFILWILESYCNLIGCSIVNSLYIFNIIILQTSRCFNTTFDGLLDTLAFLDQSNIISFFNNISTMIYTNNINICNSLNNRVRSNWNNFFLFAILLNNCDIVRIIAAVYIEMICDECRSDICCYFIDVCYRHSFIFNKWDYLFDMSWAIFFLSNFYNLCIGIADNFISLWWFSIDIIDSNFLSILIWSCSNDSGKIGWLIDVAHLESIGVVALDYFYSGNVVFFNERVLSSDSL